MRGCHSVACVLRDIVEKEFESFVSAILVVLPYYHILALGMQKIELKPRRGETVGST